MTEQEIIDYLKNSTTCFGFWPKPVQEWAKRHTQENIWLQYFAEGKWVKRLFQIIQTLFTASAQTISLKRPSRSISIIR